MRTSIYIHDKLYKEGKEAAAKDGRTFSNLITKLLSEEMRKKGKLKKIKSLDNPDIIP